MNKEEKAAESCKKILEAAIEEFGTKGYKAASTNGICERCRISKGLIFYYYKSKETLFEKCAGLCIQEFDTYMQKHFVQADSPLEGIKACCFLRKDFFMRHPAHHRIFCEVLYAAEGTGRENGSDLLGMYEKHTVGIIGRILKDVELNPRLDREKSIRMAVNLIEFIDMHTWTRCRGRERSQDKEEERRLEQLMLEEQMNEYIGYLEALLYGILV